MIDAARVRMVPRAVEEMMAQTLDEIGIVVPCAACGRSNRLAYGTLDRRTRCGHCKTDLEPVGAPVEAASATAFDAAAVSSALPLVVDFWAPWCGPCRMVAPELEQVARAHAGRWLVVKVNTDAQPELGARYRIQSIPTLAVVHRGSELARLSGVRPAAEIERFVHDATARG
jgi:thioredoxin 2